MYKLGGRPIRYDGIAPSVVAKGSYKVKGPRHTTVGETGKFDETVTLRGAPPSGYDMDNYGDTTKKGRGF